MFSTLIKSAVLVCKLHLRISSLGADISLETSCVLGAVLMASGVASSPALVFAAAAALLRCRWVEAKLGSSADSGLLAVAEVHLFSCIDVAIEVLASSPVASAVVMDSRGVPILGVAGDAAAMEVVPSVVEESVTPLSLCVGPDRDPPSPERVIEAWDALFFVDNLETEVASLFQTHRELAAAAHCRPPSAPVVLLYVDFDMFHHSSGFEILKAAALWDRWMGIVSPDRLFTHSGRGRGTKICVVLRELPRD